jgi:hypothetical protein
VLAPRLAVAATRLHGHVHADADRRARRSPGLARQLCADRPLTGSTWYGRAGAVELGPTEARVARYLASITGHGWAHVRTMDIAARLGLERSEAFRIIARLRTLGLFGVSSDRGGHGQGRRVWRTPTRHDGVRLDAGRHRAAIARIRGSARRATLRARARLTTIRVAASGGAARPNGPGVIAPHVTPGPTFADRMRLAGLGRLMDEWRVT